MASFLSNISTYSYVLSHNNKTADSKAFFVQGFDIQTANFDLLNK